MPTPESRTQLHLGSSCSLLVAVTVVVAGVVPFAWHTGIRGCGRIIPNTALLPGEVLLLQDHAGPVSCVKK